MKQLFYLAFGLCLAPVCLGQQPEHKSAHTDSLQQFPTDKSLHSSGSQTLFRKDFSLSSNLLQDQIDEFNLSGEYKINDYLTIGLGYGKIYRNSLFDPWVLSPSQKDWPGTAYHGDAYHGYVKFFPFRTRRLYLSAKGVFKVMSYSDEGFAEGTGYGHYTVSYRSETARVWGFALTTGKEFSFLADRMLLDYYWGLGYRVKDRNYTTYYETDDRGTVLLPSFPTSQTMKQKFITLETGFILGVNFNKKHPTNND